MRVCWLIGTKFEIIPEEIDIQSIEEFKDYSKEEIKKLSNAEIDEINYLQHKKYNQLLKAIKQLDKKIKEKEND